MTSIRCPPPWVQVRSLVKMPMEDALRIWQRANAVSQQARGNTTKLSKVHASMHGHSLGHPLLPTDKEEEKEDR